MNFTIYVAIFLALFILYQDHTRKKVMLKQLINAKDTERKQKMLELAKRFIGKECLVYTFNSQLTGVIKEVSDGAILLEDKNSVEAVNLDFVVRIREYPTKKNGKKKAIVLE